MCDYTQREFRCSHKRYIVSRWCIVYIRTQQRCQPCVTHFEYRYVTTISFSPMPP
ncbi:hypothetical protein GCG54_00014519 [Colletotrichum gloeosporioides]|uniref:Uncharacterized protein n=1 Tax=Colletotrichum gloeosporioides TaxID=474922 RepID=A0A8H4CXR5_COLGL|nr:uncharacterized protein GCG54_00014519 [Colletotrichum gloeosporioides]KAF3811767.1 hypothetical protein GCG54_00014519 [Colletotrichum gloeosporioides]